MNKLTLFCLFFFLSYIFFSSPKTVESSSGFCGGTKGGKEDRENDKLFITHSKFLFYIKNYLFASMQCVLSDLQIR